jgi:hypothetical protein
MRADAELFRNLFLESDDYKAMAALYSKFWSDGTRRVTTRNKARTIPNPTPGQQATADAWLNTKCSGVWDDVKECREPATEALWTLLHA